MVHLILSHHSSHQLASPQLVSTCSPFFFPLFFPLFWILSDGFLPQAPLAGTQQDGQCLGNRFVRTAWG